MKVQISEFTLRIIKERGIKYTVIYHYDRINGKDYPLNLYIIGCSPGWNEIEKSGDVCTREIGTKSFIKVGEWAGSRQFVEMNIYNLGLFATSRFDPSQVGHIAKDKLVHLPFIDYEKAIVPKNTIMYRQIMKLQNLYLIALMN